ncbi:MAG: M20/M25/M40 family metallo-hydrolase [Bacillota bacterium]|nr:M20/M25/M40 family metallo-hydrolase [Bacillota bacterium]
MTTAVILGLIFLFLLIIVTRAVRFKPSSPQYCSLPESYFSGFKQEASSHLVEMIRCQTVSPDVKGGGYDQFEKFQNLLKNFYPLVHGNLDHEKVNEHSLLYRWPGKVNDKPVLFMAHYDVVPADGDKWRKPPFEGIIENGIIYGRGTLDTKSTLCGILEAAEILLAENFQPEQDIYFAFGHDEEMSGRGAEAISEILQSRGIKLDMVLDEGGAVVHGVFPGIKNPIAVVGLSEKGIADVQVSVEGSGGHASTPGRHNPLNTLSRIIINVEKNPFKANIPVEVREMFDTLGRHMPVAYKVIFANLWLFKPLLLKMLPMVNPELNALCRSTIVFTMAEGSKASNVIPVKASAVANLRLAAMDTKEDALIHIEKSALKASRKARSAKEPLTLKVTLIEGHNASPSSSTSSEAYRKLARAINDCFRGAIVTPYIMLAASDARHFCKISNNVLRFSPIEMDESELHSIHGVDERISVEKLNRLVNFYYLMLSRS